MDIIDRNTKLNILDLWWKLYSTDDNYIDEKKEFDLYCTEYLDDLYFLLLLYKDDSISPKKITELSHDGKLVWALLNVRKFVEKNYFENGFYDYYLRTARNFNKSIIEKYNNKIQNQKQKQRVLVK